MPALPGRAPGAHGAIMALTGTRVPDALVEEAGGAHSDMAMKHIGLLGLV